MITVNFYGYTTHTDTMRKAQMIEAQAIREAESGDIDAWFYAGCPIGRGYAKWEAERVKPKNPAAVALQALRKNRRGGRPRSTAPRCACGAMTARRAAARAHKCLVTAAAPTPAALLSTPAGR